MTYFDDLSPYSYISEEGNSLNIGWLDKNHDFQKGDTSEEFIERLAWLTIYSTVKHTPGIHRCTLCQPGAFGFHLISHEGNSFILGSAEIRVKGNRAAYAAPDLLIHYVLGHRYLPPEDFISGVMVTGSRLHRDKWSLSTGPYWNTLNRQS
ncbi:conserved hypothetical protein [uncultured Desulfobacterium sp.]|uniref:DUF7919 domain-containing protein n=1 Tax=uncultured Desulfobacterium sp. TaxID=201089 RepID=A0A445N490_9BACT|nr:conserved hypothetical protein [uncultured Desulfobacterium sp.]